MKTSLRTSILMLCILAGATARARRRPDAGAGSSRSGYTTDLQSPNPSSCAQCHLATVDLKNYILPSHEKTFLSLRDQGLIDMDNPDE